MQVIIYLFIASLIIFTTVILAVKSFAKKNKIGIALGGTLTSAAAMILFYLGSIMANAEILFSVFSSLYFISVDVMVGFFLVYAYYFTQKELIKRNKIVIISAITLCVIDIIILTANIFANFVIEYVAEPDSLLGFTYKMHLGYYLHLAIDYIVLTIIGYRFVRQMLRLPWEYQKPYIAVISGISVVVAINAVWLFVPESHIWNDLDFSLWGFSLAGYFLYWTSFRYITSSMPKSFRQDIVEVIDQGVVLFAINGERIVSNARAEALLPDKCFGADVSLEEFASICGINISEYENMKIFSTQVTFGEKDKIKALRCDCHLMENKKHQTLGRLFVFSDTIVGFDLLTGFHTQENFEIIAKERKELFAGKVTVALIDMIGLKAINANQGRIAGDEKIRQLAKAMKLAFPKETFYVRGQDANLLAICRNIDEQKAKSYVKQVKEAFDGAIQYSIIARVSGQSIEDTLEGAERSLRARKLMDRQSQHSEVLTSLLVALQECDSDTEKHVERTQQMGAKLGRRIGLSELELSELSLLCILHDIGKIGIPLEILNKPGKLTEAEWVIMKSHVDKGYQIAASNQEFAPIAEMVRYHHERWDGRGYPDGLREHNIPKLSRIISIVDAYDAMVHDRIYRQAMAPETAQAEILKCAGTQFDPFIAREFVELLQEPEFKEMTDKMSATAEARREYREKTKKEIQLKLSAASENSEIEIHSFGRCVMKMDGRIIDANEKFYELTGYTKEDLEGELFLSNLIFDEDFKNYVENVSSIVRKGGVSLFTYNLKTKSGAKKKSACSTRLFYDTGRHCELGELIILN